MKRFATAICLFALAAAGAASAAYPTRISVSLVRFPGNICCPKSVRADVTATGVLTTYTATAHGGPWQRQATRKLPADALRRLRAALARFNPKDLSGNVCQGPPSGDIGGEDLRVGRYKSSCPPASASRVLRIMRAYLPKAS